MQEHDNLVFVEVRSHASPDFGAPSETVDTRKQAQRRTTAKYYLFAEFAAGLQESLPF
jgi:Holliday junction resolvase-like predicted endonuclease